MGLVGLVGYKAVPRLLKLLLYFLQAMWSIYCLLADHLKIHSLWRLYEDLEHYTNYLTRTPSNYRDYSIAGEV